MATGNLLTKQDSFTSEDLEYSERYVPLEQETGRSGARYRTGRWDENEHRIFLQGLQIHGKNWKKIAELVKTRSSVQIRTHAQKFFIKAARHGVNVSHLPRIDQQKNEWDIAQDDIQSNEQTTEEPKNTLSIPLINEDCELFANLPVHETNTYETKSIDNSRALEPLPIVDFDTQFMSVDDVSTPRTLNINRLAPSLDEKTHQLSQIGQGEKAHYKRALDMEDALSGFSFAADGYYTKSVTQIEAPAPLEFSECTDLEDELSLVSTESPDVLSGDDNMAFDDKDLDFFFSDEFRECKKPRLVAGF